MAAPRWRYLVFGYVAVLVLVSLLAVGLLFQLTLDNEADLATATAQFATLGAAEAAASQAQSLALAGQSQAWLAAGRPAHALAAALAAVEIDPYPAEVQASLAEAAYASGIRQRIILPELYTSGDLAIAPDGQTVYYGGLGIGAVDVTTGEPLPWRLASLGICGRCPAPSLLEA